MIRLLLTYIIPLALPVLAWLVWRRYIAPPPVKGNMRDEPWHWLVLAGVALMVVMLGVLAFWGEDGRDGDFYIAPRLVDGKVVPGHHIPAGSQSGSQK